MTSIPANPLGTPLNSNELRVLGCLIEKEITTPELYPLSLNALVNAANQRSSRDPVVDLNERQVREALDSLEARELVHSMHDARVPKYEHRARTVLNLRRDETALLCLLLLRGPQTPGELRSRSDRLFAFDDLPAVQTTLDRLSTRAPQAGAPGDPRRTTPLIIQLSRQPGSRETRFAHLLGEPPSAAALAPPQPLASPPPQPAAAGRLDQLEADMAALREQVARLTARLDQLDH